MSRWDDYNPDETYDPNKDYSVQVQRNDGGLSATQRALASIEESKQIGASTAVELHRQREVLERTRDKLDESEAVLRESEGHMKSIKSFWGQMTQKWFGPKPKDANAKNSPKKYTDQKPSSSSQVPNNSDPPSTNFQSSGRGDALSQQLSSKNLSREQQIEKNLGDMSSGLRDLKNLGLTLQTELESQDDLIDDVDHRVQRNKLKQDRLNKQMNQLLKKK